MSDEPPTLEEQIEAYKALEEGLRKERQELEKELRMRRLKK